MSILKKMMASVGIGNAKVDTRLAKAQFMPGEMITGECHIQGGQVAQEVGSIYLDIMTHYRRDDMYVTSRLVHYRLNEKMTLAAGESKVIPFSIQLPWQTPLTLGHYPVWVQTGLDIVAGADASDRDQIDVVPNPLQAAVLSGVESLGFQLYKVDAEYSPRFGGQFSFVQEFEFKAHRTHYASALEELEVMFFPSEQGLDVLLVLDRRSRGFGGFMDEWAGSDDRHVRRSYTHADAARGPQFFAEDLNQIIHGTLQRG